jgi:hypothetical protein
VSRRRNCPAWGWNTCCGECGRVLVHGADYHQPLCLGLREERRVVLSDPPYRTLALHDYPDMLYGRALPGVRQAVRDLLRGDDGGAS